MPRLLVPLLTLLFFLSASAASSRPNVLLIVADDLGYGDLSCYGAPDCKTPALDALAASGARFTDAYAAFPVCSPSRAALLAGRYPQRFGPTYEDYFGSGSPGLDPARHPTLGSLLKASGYATACFGKWNVNNYERETTGPLQHGFDTWTGFHLNHNYFTHLSKSGEEDFWINQKRTKREGVTDNILADETITWLQSRKGERQDKPFFIYLAFQAPHDPMMSPAGPPDQPEFKSKPEQRPLNIELIQNLDRQTARILATLKETGFDQNTLIVFTSDNGGHKAGRNLPLNGHKQELLEGGIRVPLIIAQPGLIAAGRVIKDPVIAMDLTATITAAAQVPADRASSFDGLDLLPLLTGKEATLPERPLFFRRRHVDARAGTTTVQAKAVRQGPWKLLIDTRRPGKEKVSLYNLETDLPETTDLSAKAPEVLHRLREKLTSWEAQVDTEAAKAPHQKALPPKGKTPPEPK